MLKHNKITEKNNIIPTISIKKEIQIVSGSGTLEDPYVVSE